MIRFDHATAYVPPAATDLAARAFGADLVRLVTRAWQLRTCDSGGVRFVAIIVIITFRAPTPLRTCLRSRALIGCRRHPFLPYR
jgi:hypothetical protein